MRPSRGAKRFKMIPHCQRHRDQLCPEHPGSPGNLHKNEMMKKRSPTRKLKYWNLYFVLAFSLDCKLGSSTEQIFRLSLSWW